jgi:hypothetical protein
VIGLYPACAIGSDKSSSVMQVLQLLPLHLHSTTFCERIYIAASNVMFAEEKMEGRGHSSRYEFAIVLRYSGCHI